MSQADDRAARIDALDILNERAQVVGPRALCSLRVPDSAARGPDNLT
jgi:hypothetical protein